MTHAEAKFYTAHTFRLFLRILIFIQLHLLLENNRVKMKLQLLVREVNAQLLEGVDLERLKAENIKVN